MRRRRSWKTNQKKGIQDEPLQTQETHMPDSISINPEKENCEDGGSRFYGCYLLTSLSPRFKGHTYIGYVYILSNLIPIIF